MVHIKRVVLSQFKSFGETAQVPLLPGFTVISGPNGSGKSNILDALLFCLGLSSSKGMRADRLPDLVNHNKTHKGTAETSVTVTFDLRADTIPNWDNLPEDSESAIACATVAVIAPSELSESANLATEIPPATIPEPEILDSPVPESKNSPQGEEWSVTRRLRVTTQGSYTSNYYINGEACTLTDLHEQLNRLRIYPEGYNVVLQGDVTSIISMNPKERREIIDEMAGVANFDRKINQTKETLDSVKEREDHYQIVEQELQKSRDRLSQDCLKAEKYQKLKLETLEKEALALIISYQLAVASLYKLQEQIAASDQEALHRAEQLEIKVREITSTTARLETLDAQVKALGEDELLKLQGNLATQTAQQQQLESSRQELLTNTQGLERNLAATQQAIATHQQELSKNLQRKQTLEVEILQTLRPHQEASWQNLQTKREEVNAIASAATAWMQQQTDLHQRIEALQAALEPGRTELALVCDRTTQLQQQIHTQTPRLEQLEAELTQLATAYQALATDLEISTAQVQTIAQQLAGTDQQLQIQQATQTRLTQEQREKQRQLDKLEATNQAQQEAQGTYASKVLLQADIPGICGLVAQLGRVAPEYQLALETAAGGRMGNLVVEDDGVAAAGIQILKQKRAGRLTFLPLNKLSSPRLDFPVERLRQRFGTGMNGFIDYAVNLIDYDPKYQKVFAYVFGNTIVFDSLDRARSYLGQGRMITLAGELLEASGAMTGGSSNQGSTLHFGNAESKESTEMANLRNRLEEISNILDLCDTTIIDLLRRSQSLSQQLTTARETRQGQQLRLEQLSREKDNLQRGIQEGHVFLAQYQQELEQAGVRSQTLQQQLPQQEIELQSARNQLAQLQQSQTHDRWQEMQATIKAAEEDLSQKTNRLRTKEQELQDGLNQEQRLTEKITTAEQTLITYIDQKAGMEKQQAEVLDRLTSLQATMRELQAEITLQEQKLGAAKLERDQLEKEVRSLHLNQQQLEFQLQQLQQTQLTRREEMINLQAQLREQKTELPETIPEIPPQQLQTGYLNNLQGEIKLGQKKLQAMEPVNMLALDEYKAASDRLQELSDKLTTLNLERTELLLRMENFTTLRFQAFKEAFDAVNENFQGIFAELSDGDGYLQLDNPEDPFVGGLNLVAHPKGKPVQRLSSMSGGEKSLTALSFIFALQRYRPSPFYAFDEVDMFLDGANVERLARMIKKQTQHAQFIVVSLRRPMIESAERTIGVTQARGAYTQVLGIKLTQESNPKNAIQK